MPNAQNAYRRTPAVVWKRNERRKKKQGKHILTKHDDDTRPEVNVVIIKIYYTLDGQTVRQRGGWMGGGGCGTRRIIERADGLVARL